MVGTGNAFSKKLFNNNGLIHANHKMWLIDCGYLATRGLLELGIELNQIHGIVITHTHADHVGGLEEVAFRAKYEYNHRIKLCVPSLLVNTLWENTLRGGLENIAEGMNQLSDYFEVIPLYDGIPLYLDDHLLIEIIRTLHVPNKPSYSLFLNKYVFYSSDMQFMPEFLLHEVIATRQCKTIIHDCQLQGMSVVHASLEQLRTIPSPFHSMIYLMHYGDHMELYEGDTGEMRFLRQHVRYYINAEGEILV
jgi:hypothetical protein